MVNANFWRRSKDGDDGLRNCYRLENSFEPMFTQLGSNAFVDIHTKQAALEVSRSLVSLISYSGEEQICWASGVIIESDYVNSTFLSTVLTSATILRLNGCEDSLPDNFKVEVILCGGNLYSGNVVAYNWHYNIAAIKIESTGPLPAANLRCLDDAITLKERSFQLRPHSNLLKVSPGDDFVALGRYYSQPYDLMVAPGKYCIDHCNLECEELLRVNCRITKCGIGGPMINLHGEVVGINFYTEDYTPFLPTNVIGKWWESVKSCRDYNQPWLGMQVATLGVAAVDELENFMLKFPDLSEGVIVEEVTPESPAAVAGICPADIIIQFDGKNVGSCLELFETAWDNVGKRVGLVVLRGSNDAPFNTSVLIGRIGTGQINRWPLPDEYWKIC